MADHEQCQEDVAAYVAGRLGGEGARRLEAHVAECDDCAAVVESWLEIAEGFWQGGVALLEAHPDTAEIRAYVSGTASSDVHARIERHLGTCAPCSLEVRTGRTRHTVVPFRPARAKTVSWFGIPASLAAMLLLGVGIGFFFRFGSPPETELSPAVSAPTWSGPVSLLLLERPSRGVSTMRRFRVDAGQPYVPLAVPVVVPEGSADAELFRFTVRDEGGRVLWWSQLPAGTMRQQMAASGVVSFLVPASDLEPGRKMLRFARALTPEPGALLEIPFEIEFR
jgi:hypothetical protein